MTDPGKPTTIVVICLAGDPDTETLIETALYEIQLGLISLSQSRLNQTTVVTFYYRPRVDGPHGFWFRLRADSPQFTLKNGCQTLDRPLSSIAGARSIEAEELSEQIASFCHEVQKEPLHSTSSVHVIIAAHGRAGRGVSPTVLNRELSQTLFPCTLPASATSFSNRLRSLIIKLRHPHQIPGALFVDGNSEVVLLDELNRSLQALGEIRSLFLHTCNLSMLEVMYALNSAPLHFAFMRELEFIRFSRFFEKLSNPECTETELVTSVADSISNQQPDLDWFSSHHTLNDQDLSILDALGESLQNFLINEPLNAAKCISNSRKPIDQACYFIDSLAFLRSITKQPNVPESVSKTAEECATLIQMKKLAQHPQTKETGCISLFLPAQHAFTNAGLDLRSALPESFLSRASHWFDFLSAWVYEDTTV